MTGSSSSHHKTIQTNTWWTYSPTAGEWPAHAPIFALEPNETLTITESPNLIPLQNEPSASIATQC